ncbi:MAG: endonuclease III [Clostridia bacterium]|nr:endonuclease III [Clostridia bacterium]
MTQNQAILNELSRLYPDAGPELDFTNPFETLIATMLAAQCTDRQVNKVTPKLFASYPDAASMAALTSDELHPWIRSCGFRSKAVNITATCRILVENHGGKVPDTLEALTALPGVGRKTANVVLANAFGIPAFAVDTHVFRVSNRLGLVRAKDVKQAELQLMDAVPREDWIVAHHWMILHGRRVCDARRPACDRCTLAALCAYRSGVIGGIVDDEPQPDNGHSR